MLGTALVAAPGAFAQESQKLPEVVAEADRDQPSYRPGTGADSGTTRIEQEEVKARTPGSGDVNQLLKALPTVQFSRDEGLATRENIQDIRPADISISGGRIYDNLFTLDGVDMSSRLDTTSDAGVFDINGTAPASPQSLWVDSNLVGAITLRDSNVSAEHGRFTGGALNIETRDPRPVLGGAVTLSYSSDALTSFKLSEPARDQLGADLPDKPNFEKIRYGVSWDVPVTDDVQTLFAFNRSRADVTYYRGNNYGNRAFGQRSQSDNFLGKMTASLDAATQLTGQLVYSPYESEASNANGVDNQIVSHGGGLTGKLGLRHSGTVDWSIDASVAHSRTDRDAQPFNYSISSSVPNGAVCAAANCTRGGFGDLEQRQTNYALTARASADLGPGRLSGGLDLQQIDARRERPEDGGAYSTAQLGNNIVCAAGDSLTCVTGQYALGTFLEYRAFRAQASLRSVAGWAEYRLEAGAFDVRAGLRYDYESYLDNHNVAPRLSAAYTLPGSEWTLTLGANRYYGRAMLAYALREQYPANFIYDRSATVQNGQRIYSDNWILSTSTFPLLYSGAGRPRTPYSDELSTALSAPVLGGTLRLRGIYRDGKDEFTRSTPTLRTIVLETGRTATYREYVLTNDGTSRYRGGSIEWQRSFGKHSIALNTNFSKTRTTNDDYLADSDDLIEGFLVAYQGQLYSIEQIAMLSQREDFASPFILNGTWTARWLADRVTTNLNVRYRDPFRRIEDTGRTATIDGVRYDEYDWIRYPASIDANLNVQAEVMRNRFGTLTLDLRIANLFDSIPSRNATAIAQPYQFGRSAWTGLNFRF